MVRELAEWDGRGIWSALSEEVEGIEGVGDNFPLKTFLVVVVLGGIGFLLAELEREEVVGVGEQCESCLERVAFFYFVVVEDEEGVFRQSSRN